MDRDDDAVMRPGEGGPMGMGTASPISHTAATAPVPTGDTTPYELVTRDKRVIGVVALPRGTAWVRRGLPSSAADVSLPPGIMLFELVSRNGLLVGLAP